MASVNADRRLPFGAKMLDTLCCCVFVTLACSEYSWLLCFIKLTGQF